MQIRWQHIVSPSKCQEMVSIVFVPIQSQLFYLQHHVNRSHQAREHHWRKKRNLNRTNTSRFLLCTAQLLPSFMIFYWIIFLRISFKISCINKLYAKKTTRKSWIFVRQSTDFLRELLISDYKIELHVSMLSKLMHRHLPCLCICLPRQC